MAHHGFLIFYFTGDVLKDGSGLLPEPAFERTPTFLTISYLMSAIVQFS
jgi:hypothetical protein